MRIPNYKKRAAQAAEDWNRIQAQKKSETNELEEDIFVSPEIKNQSIEQTVAELIDDISMPKTTVKGIHIVKDQKVKEELRDIA